jgi:hypothetical protein
VSARSCRAHRKEVLYSSPQLPGRKQFGGLPRWSRGVGFILRESVEEINVDFVRLAAVRNDLVHIGHDVEHRLLTAAGTVEEDLLALGRVQVSFLYIILTPHATMKTISKREDKKMGSSFIE